MEGRCGVGNGKKKKRDFTKLRSRGVIDLVSHQTSNQEALKRSQGELEENLGKIPKASVFINHQPLEVKEDLHHLYRKKITLITNLDHPNTLMARIKTSH
eukprot:TRINITY_DN9318_c0_g1_i1.p1 TRINITY_DN9318_c0_g1~~TRINITY_DN9318_c0_g1_i1.p1  ORF type:complete len:100 (+),score=13.42 TRINITY_DN9318_c0_g1_i1:1851-2150(+)